MTPGTVTVAITNWNYGQYLQEAIGSIKCQTRQPDDWYIVDDASTDKESLDIYQSLEPRRLILQGTQKGAAAAYNTALRMCTTDWLIMLDADDGLQCDYVEAMLSTAHEKNVDWVYCDSELIDEHGALIGRCEYRDFDKFALFEANYISASALIKADVLRRAGGFRVCVLKDWDMWKRVAGMNVQAAKCDETSLRYRQHGQSQMHGGRGLY